MKHLSPPLPEEEAGLKMPTRRTLAKQKTRAKVLEAARRLFSEQGYEGATIRDIAAAAGMSTGAVFANFTDKSDLFHEIMTADISRLVEAMAASAGKERDLIDRLLDMFMVGYSFYQSQLPLARAAFSVAWAPEGAAYRRTAPAVAQIVELITAQIGDAAGQGEIGGDELELRGEMLFEAYLCNYPRAIFEAWTLDALRERCRRQIEIILAGVRV